MKTALESILTPELKALARTDLPDSVRAPLERAAEISRLFRRDCLRASTGMSSGGRA